MATRWNATACAAWWLKEAVRLHAGFATQPGHDYVVVAQRRDALTALFEKLASELVSRIETRPKHRRPENGPLQESITMENNRKLLLAIDACLC